MFFVVVVVFKEVYCSERSDQSDFSSSRSPRMLKTLSLICFNMYQREIKLSEACHSRRLTEIMPANLLNGKDIMQYKRNLSNAKSFYPTKKV